MPATNNQLVRYLILDRLFRNPHGHYRFWDLYNEVNDELRSRGFKEIKDRILHEDIRIMQSEDEGFGVKLKHWFEGRERIYQYEDLDYSILNQNLTLEEMNQRLHDMLEMFNDETDNGKLYVSYPMVESLCYTKELPDEHFVEYAVSRCDCMERPFKDMAKEFSFYGSLDFIELPDAGHHKPSKREYARVKQNWIWLVDQHTSKASYICTGVAEPPVDKDTVAQPRIFEAQCGKYLCDGEKIAVLNGFPLFLFEYFKELK